LAGDFSYRAFIVQAIVEEGIMVRVRHYTKISLLVFILLMQGILVRSGLADCQMNGGPGSNGTAGNDTIVCDNNPAQPTQVTVAGGSGGNDTIIIDSNNQLGIAGDGTVSGMGISSAAVAGNDTIIVNGNTAAAVYGDFLNTNVNGAADTIIINGTASTVQGDVLTGSVIGGSDTIIINGTVTNAVIGDTHSFPSAGDIVVAGNDTITVNGTVGSVSGETFGAAGTKIGGGDTITINSTAQVNGNVTGEINATVGGNDQITIEVGATVVGTISGGNAAGDYDLLTFTGQTTDQAGYQQIQAFVGCNPCGGSVTIDGQTYTFQNFEQLQNLMTLIVAGSNVVIRFTPQPDDRINWRVGDWLIPIYNHNGDTRGVLVNSLVDGLWIPETDLPTDIPAANTLVDCNDSGSICLYKLAGNGYWMVDANLVVDGRAQHTSVIFDSLNPSTVTSS
jgi:hypothetical protein